jgi:hypothetical protein
VSSLPLLGLFPDGGRSSNLLQVTAMRAEKALSGRGKALQERGLSAKTGKKK